MRRVRGLGADEPGQGDAARRDGRPVDRAQDQGRGQEVMYYRSLTY